MTTRIHFKNAMDRLNQEVLLMGTMVEEAIQKAIRCLIDQDIALANRIIDDDDLINDKEVLVEDLCTIFIAKEQPVAGDLRHIITLLKIVTQLERMGDHAVHIAKAAVRLSEEVYMKPLIDIPRMAETGVRMIREVLTAFIEEDTAKAEAVAKMDDTIDNLHEQVMREVLTYMMESPAYIKQSMNFIFVSRYLERLGDHVTNICEWIVYDVTGKHTELNF